MSKFWMAGFGLLLCAGSTVAQAADLTVSDAWSRATPSGQSSAVVYLTVKDSGAPDTLTGASTPVASAAQLHESRTANGVTTMRPVGTVQVSPDHELTLAPGGLHLMLTGMKQQLKTGDTFPLTVTFAHAGAVETKVTVRGLGAGTHDMHGMRMDEMH